MIELFARTETTYIEKANGNLVFGNTEPLAEKGTMELVIGTDRFLIPIDANGFWRWEATTPYADGNYSLSLRQIDRAGNISLPTLATIVIDSTPPEAPVLINLYDDQGAEQRSFDPGSTTDDKRPTLTGVAQKGATVYLLNDKNEKIGSAVADKDTGVWKMEPMQDLEDGTNNLRLVAEETFANVPRTGSPSAQFTIVIGEDASVLPPNTITIKEALDDVGTYMGKLSSGALTDDTTPTLRGDVSAGNTVTVYYRLAGSSTWTGSATATVNGTEWSWTPGSALAYGEYEFQASIGGFSSSLFTLDIATAADIASKTRIEMVKDDFGAWQGELSSGAITDDATPTFSGRGEANGKVVLRFAQVGQLANTVVVDVDSSGKWMWTPASGLPAGNWSFEVQPQGHNAWSNTFSLSITGSDGFNPVITDGYDDMGTPKALANGDTTDDTTPTLNGQAEANSIVYLRATNGTTNTIYSTKADSKGDWTLTPSPALPYGNWDFQTSKTSTGGWGDAFNLKIDSGIVQPSNGMENFTYAHSYFEKGKIYNLTSGAKLVMNEQGWEGQVGNKSGFYSGSLLNVNLDSKVTLEIPSPSNKFEISSLQGGTPSIGLVRFLSATKSVIGTLNINNLEGSYPNYHTFSFTSKSADIHFVEIKTTSGASTAIDWIQWGNGVYSTNEEQPQSAQLLNHDDSIHQLYSADDLASQKINGSEDKINTLQLTGSGELLDLTAQNSPIESIEIIDITGSGDNILKLDLNALLQHGEKDLFIEDGKTQLLVKGNEGDVVQLKDILPEGSDISEWQHQDGTVTVAGVEYNVYSHGDDAELLVQHGVKTELV
ncbi:Ig-like domain-containing protein [Pantoea sp. S18]|uniref:Ig-like domain-containing protein n=1 Tax=Pantoea sp. S18 TaxID=3019892 RepID=UPI002B1ECCA4|nr:Ig-like domain-containing protein [Pantoea sp. S18]MEA5104085.1 Ig-like domain-containing protein [Pantoea sp. S18]